MPLQTRASDDKRYFAEGFVAGWCSMLGHRALPTIIPECQVPVDKSPFQHGYDEARSFVDGVQRDGQQSETNLIRGLCND
jgi:hypothetical protein